jgi:hypothetical protein
MTLGTPAWADSMDKAQANDANTAGHKLGAKSLINQGNARFSQESYQEALQLYQAAYELYPSPKILFNVGQAAEKLGRYVMALANYERFLEAKTTKPISQKMKEAATAAHDRVKKNLATLVMTGSPADATVKIDDEDRGTLAGFSVFVNAGKRRVLVQHPAHLPDEHQITAVGQTTHKLHVDLKSSVAAKLETPLYDRPWFWSVVGIVVVAGATTGIWAATQSGDVVPAELGSSSWSEWEKL